MKYDPQKHPFDKASSARPSQGRRRRSIRLPEYDYSRPGAYFITIVTRGRECRFGETEDGQMHLNHAGQILWGVWNSLPARYPQIVPGTAQVMPNHFHGILTIPQTPVGVIHESPLRGNTGAERRRMTIPLVVGYFKMNTAKRINELSSSQGTAVWQRNDYEQILRDAAEHNRIYLYIETNAPDAGAGQNPSECEPIRLRVT